MIDVSYEKLYRAIYPTLPADWQRVVIRAAFGDGNSSIKYYVQQHDGEYCDCFELVTDQAAVLESIAKSLLADNFSFNFPFIASGLFS